MSSFCDAEPDAARDDSGTGSAPVPPIAIPPSQGTSPRHETQPPQSAEAKLDDPAYASYREKSGTAAAAGKYPHRFSNTWKDQSERRAILTALADVPSGAHVLDLPCGSGRVTSLLVERGYRVTGADVSKHMAEQARRNWSQTCVELGTDPEAARFDVQNALHTTYADSQFDAVICSRLFHHFSEPALRQTALRELARISRGPIVVSFFNRCSLDALRRRVRSFLRGDRTRDRAPISLSQFTADGRAAGLKVARTVATRWGISPLCYVVFHPHDDSSRAPA